MAQQAWMYLDLNDGEGWRPLNDRSRDVAALDSFSIQWGTDNCFEQPDPAVLSFRLYDREGMLAGKAALLAGARVCVTCSSDPMYFELKDDTRAYMAMGDVTLRDLHNQVHYAPPSTVSFTQFTIFNGIVTTGGTVRHHKGDAWILHLSATGISVLWKRLQSQGPTSTDRRLDGYHWTGTPADRLAEMNRRAKAVGAPTADATGLILPPSLAPYSDDFPSQLDLLHRMFAYSGRAPLWYETYEATATTLSYVMAGDLAQRTLDPLMHVHVSDGVTSHEVLDGNVVETSDPVEFDLPEPYTQVVIHGHSVSLKDGHFEFGDTETVQGDRDTLPAGLDATQKSASVSTDAIVSPVGVAPYNPWQPTSAQRSQIAQLLLTIDTRLRPKSIVFDSRHLAPFGHPHLFRAQPAMFLAFTRTIADRLDDMDGLPAIEGAWSLLGGTLTYDWHHGEPRFRHEATLWPHARADVTDPPTYADMAPVSATYEQVPDYLDIRELQTINTIQEETP
ncbi:hypothetical protein PG2072B_1519 [Bifidobacterium pseudolongum subsp. globosum]|uniref:Uncharacterized protein n=1 Tax=Bifidobacterium pseudolongum subsp. globosum TaxID=1690 RepID=A0A4Q5BDI7_9BIFI|nr:hypothetical protein [Bifidobacterium pseudolongum]RYQ66081.1 hypothetical protein PG2072B_1519 [Bifidobacterium pseudolongum subsp. globosum]